MMQSTENAVEQVADLQGRTVVVTGAGRGIGAALTRRLLDLGADVLAMVQPDTTNPELDDHVANRADHLTVLPIDVTDTRSVQEAATRAQDVTGRIDVLVNNAGVIEPIGRVGDLDPDRWGEVFAVNAVGAMRTTQAFLPLLTDTRGTVVNMSSGSAHRPLEGWSAYCSSKAALAMLSQVTDLEYRDSGITVLALGVPPTDTGMQGAIRSSGLNAVSRIPRAELHPPAAIAEVVAWLCSDQARTVGRVEIDARDEMFVGLLEAAR